MKRDHKGGCLYKKRRMPTEDKALRGHTEKAAIHNPRKAALGETSPANILNLDFWLSVSVV